MGKEGGIFVGKSHAKGGIPFVVKDTGARIEVEGGEPLMAASALLDRSIKKITGTNRQVLHTINKRAGAKGLDEKATEVKSQQAIVCKNALADQSVRTWIGTNRQITSAINVSAGCKLIEDGAQSISADGKVVHYRNGGMIPKMDVEGTNRAGIIIVCNSEILLVRGRGAGGKLSIPKGRMEAGEELVAAMIRECIEETGISFAASYIRWCNHARFTTSQGSLVCAEVYLRRWEEVSRKLRWNTDGYEISEVVLMDADMARSSVYDDQRQIIDHVFGPR